MAFDVFIIEIVRAVEGIFSVIDEIKLKKREKGNEACFSLSSFNPEMAFSSSSPSSSKR